MLVVPQLGLQVLNLLDRLAGYHLLGCSSVPHIIVYMPLFACEEKSEMVENVSSNL